MGYHMINQNICNDRKIFIEELTEKIKQNPSGVYCFLGKNGTGKEYVLKNIENHLGKHFSYHKIIGDSIYSKKFNSSKTNYSFEISLQLMGIIGLSLSVQNNDSTKTNYIIANLKRIARKKHIFISAVNYDCISSEGREFLSILINNKQFIEQKLKKEISIIITSNNDYFDNYKNINRIRFREYSRADLYDYMLNELKCPPNDLTSKKINEIYRLCGTNFDLVNCYYKYLLHINCDVSISTIVDEKLRCYISAGLKYNISKEVLQNIIYIAADSISTFTPHMISNISDSNETNIVTNSLNCACEEYILERYQPKEQIEFNNFLFISNEEKSYICKTAALSHEDVIIKYYNYLSTYVEDDYFQRAQYLYQYFKKVNKGIFSLVILALSKAYLLNDYAEILSIDNFLTTININSKITNTYNDIKAAYFYHYNGELEKSSKKIKSISFDTMADVAIAEIRRLEFKNGQLGYILNRNELNTLLQQLMSYIEQGLLIFKNNVFPSKEERILEMRIIFDIAPYSLDSQNDVETFKTLYDKSLLLENQIQQNNVKKSYTEYIVNIFNRKAFLFAAPAVALVHYEQAETFFRENNILNELAITLSSKAGMNISLNRYDDAINNSKEAIKIIKSNKITVNQIEKIYNNLYIAQFLKYEMNTEKILDINKFALKIINKLKYLLDNKPSGKNHVILTNVASLYLYVGDVQQYLDIKAKIEKSLNCDDVSDIDNNRVNDFYRYHFAWFEFYRFLINEEWDECVALLEKLSEFYPAIFHDRKRMDLRIKAAKNLVENQKIPSAKQYCLNFLEYAKAPQHYFSRGLLLSDLQFTSFN